MEKWVRQIYIALTNGVFVEKLIVDNIDNTIYEISTKPSKKIRHWHSKLNCDIPLQDWINKQ